MNQEDSDKATVVQQLRSAYLSKPYVDTSSGIDIYSIIHARNQPIFTDFMEHTGYHDVLLIDSDGVVIYSVLKDQNFAINLKGEAYLQTKLANIFKEVLTTINPDFTLLGDSGRDSLVKKLGLLVAAPIFIGSKLAGVLVLELPTTHTDAIIQSRIGPR